VCGGKVSYNCKGERRGLHISAVRAVMSVLSAQTIRSLCCDEYTLYGGRPLISPFHERGVIRGRSYGLSACSYDARIDHALILRPGECALASTIERFIFPNDICGHVYDKSSFARPFISVFNTHFDPGFEGFATIEMANLGRKTLNLERGDPICQFVFMSLDEPTLSPYDGKYQDQERGPQEARYEEAK
jgi:dCTP deaminase